MQYATVAAWNADPRTTSVEPGSTAEALLVQQLQAASDDVDEAILTAVYRHGPDGSPLDAAIAAALSSACIEQARYTGEVDPDGLGVAYGPMSLGSLQLPAGGSGGSGGSGGWLAPAAWRILRSAGLITNRVAG